MSKLVKNISSSNPQIRALLKEKSQWILKICKQGIVILVEKLKS
jgi:hypothetical protein